MSILFWRLSGESFCMLFFVNVCIYFLLSFFFFFFFVCVCVYKSFYWSDIDLSRMLVGLIRLSHSELSPDFLIENEKVYIIPLPSCWTNGSFTSFHNYRSVLITMMSLALSLAVNQPGYPGSRWSVELKPMRKCTVCHLHQAKTQISQRYQSSLGVL